MPWNDNALSGVKRFISRVYGFVLNNKDNFAVTSSNDVSLALNEVIEYTKKAMPNFQFNTTVAKYMELINLFEKVGPENVSLDDAKAFVVMLAPFAPFTTEDIWSDLGLEYSVHNQLWPNVKEGIEISDEIEIPVQINGKVRGKVRVNKAITKEEIQKLVESSKDINKYFENKDIKNFVYVPGKIVSIVL
jgi:leucyl-tRNA synthetase